MEENNKKKIRFNVIDLVIVVLILACIAGIYIRKNIVNSFDGSSYMEKAEISFFVQNVKYTAADYFVSGKDVYISALSSKLGEFMKGFTITPSESCLVLDDGTIAKFNFPEGTQIDVRGKILCEGKWTEDGFFVNGNCYVAAGSTMDVQTSDYAVTIIVTDISKAS